MKTESQKSVLHWIIPVLPLLLITLFVFQNPILPFQEFPDWQFQGWLWNQYVFHNNSFDGYYMMYSYIPPNSTFTILIGMLNSIATPVFAGKIAVLVSCMVLFTGIFLFVKMHLRDAAISSTEHIVAATATAFLFVFNFNLFFGQVHFLLGLGIALTGAFLFREKRWGAKPMLMTLILTLCYCTHFMAFSQLVLYMVVTTIVEKRYEYIRPSIIALIPAGILFTHYFFSSNITGVDATLNTWQTLKEKIVVFPRIIAPFVRFRAIIGGVESEIKILNFAITSAWMGAVLWTLFIHIKRKHLTVLDWMTVITFLIAITLPTISLGMFAPGERFVMMGAIAGMILFLAEFPRFRLNVIAALVILSIANYGWSQYQTSKFEATVKAGLVINETDNSGLVDPTMRFAYYKALKEQKTIPIFTTGLFGFSNTSKPGIFFNTGQTKVNKSDTSTTNQTLYDPYR